MTFEEKVRSIPEKANVDILVAVSPENFWYISQAFIITAETIRPRQAFAILPRRGSPAVLVCAAEKGLADRESWIRDIRTYTEFADQPIDALVSVTE